MDENIYLVGLMAVGKTTIGRLLAKSLSREFYDSDDVVESRSGTDIEWIFDKEGEKGFRDREESVLRDLCKKKGIIVSTGGGAVLRAANRRLLSSNGVVIHLDGSIDMLVKRTERDRSRPLLRDGNPQTILAELKEKRDGLYQQVADYKFVTDAESPMVIARSIVDRLRMDGKI